MTPETNITEQEKTEHLASANDRFVRWQEKQISLFTFCINLLFTLSIATVGFIVNNFNDDIFKDKLFLSYSLPRTASIIVVASALFGFAALLSRLFDFRYTKDTIRNRTHLFKLQNKIKSSSKLTEQQLKDNISKLTACTKSLGCFTWWLFAFQVITYFAAVIIIVMNI